MISASDLRKIDATATTRAGMEGPFNNPSAFFYVPFTPSGTSYELQGERGVLNFTVPNPLPLDNNGPFTTVADTLQGPLPNPVVFASTGWYNIVSLPRSLASETADGVFSLHMAFDPSTSLPPSPAPTAAPITAGAIDLVFCIDTTGSMDDDIQQVKDQAAMIINTLASMTSDFRIGLVGYRDIGSYPADDPIFQDFPFTNDVQAITANINALTADGGGDDPEAVYEALMRAMDNVTLGQWRNGAGKIIILMGDAEPHEKGDIAEDGTSPYLYSVSDVATVAQNLDPVRIFPVLTGGSSEAAQNAFKQLATLTGGQVFTADEAAKVPEVIASVISTAVTEVSRVFSDISGHWAQKELEKLSKIGILKGFPDGFFKPDQNITRAQFAKVITIALRIPEVKPASPTFPDVATNHWAYGYVEAAVKRGLLTGFPDGTFRPEDPVSKPQIAKIISQENGWTASPVTPSFSDIGKDHWAFPYVEGALKMGILRKPDPHINQSDTTFGDMSVTRAQSCVLVYRMMEATGAFEPATPTPSPTPSPTATVFGITEAKICTQLDADNQPVNPAVSFPASSTSKLYCWLAYTGAISGKSEITIRWYYAGEQITEPTTVQAKQANGTAAFHIEMAETGSTFPAGEYKAELYAGSTLALTVPFTLN
ncbi:MAG: S-layer homology domain-containing protein [bacterium]